MYGGYSITVGGGVVGSFVVLGTCGCWLHEASSQNNWETRLEPGLDHNSQGLLYINRFLQLDPTS